MYQAGGGRRKRRRWGSIFAVTFTFLCAVAIGLGAGYAGARLNLIPDVTDAAPEAPLPSPENPDTTEQGAAVSKTTVVEEPETSKPPAKEGFLVKAQDGEVCVFRVSDLGETVYSHKLSVELDSLRPEDRKQFEEGIRLHSKQELVELVEDFSS